jgi:glycosyltransferase involved in cell wall biosynthesis
MKKISIVTACYNEEMNVENLYLAVKSVFQKDLKKYKYEHIFIDNASKDKTVEELKKIAKRDKNVKIIVNARNFGHIRSPYHGLLQADGDAVISLVADFQDPPQMIADFVHMWENGNSIVVGVKSKSKESPLIFMLRKLFYILIRKFGETEHIDNFTGFGLYDKKVISVLRQFKDPYPYFRGLIAEIGFKRAAIDYVQPKRKAGKTKNNFYSLYDMAMLGFVNNSKIPLRVAAFAGFAIGAISFIVALVYLTMKLVFWDRFQMGTAPIIIGLFFFSSVQLFFIGILGEYIGAIYTQVKDRPLVIENERVNF